MDKVEERAKAAAEQVAKVGHAMLALGTVMTGLAALAVKEASTFETLKTRLTSVTGSVEAGAAAFERLKAIAKTTPYDLEQVTDAGAILASFLNEDTEAAIDLTKNIADLAAFMAVDLPTAASSFGRAMAGGRAAAIMLRYRGILKLVGSFYELKTGVKLAEDDIVSFRKALIMFVTDVDSPIAGATDRLSKTFAGAVGNMKDAIQRLSASLGDTLLPPITGVVVQLMKFIETLERLPVPLKAAVMGFTTLGGVITLAVGGFLSFLPRILATATALKTMGTAVLATGATITGVVAIIGAAAAATYLWTTRINQAYDATNKTARSQNDLANAVRRLTKGTKEWYEAEAARLESVASGNKKILDQAAAYRALAASMKDTKDAAKELTDLEKESLIAQGATLDRIREGALNLLRGIKPSGEEGIQWLVEPLDETLRYGYKAIEKTIDWLGALQQAAGAAGQSLGQMFSDMAEGAEVNLGKVIEGIAKLIAKLLIMAALYAIPGVGPILSQFAGGFFGAVGFDNPVSDTKAWRWGADFVRQFDQGMSSMLSGGLSLPQMQPAAIGGMGGGLAFDIHVHEPGPDTYVKVVRRGVAAMSDNEAFGLYRNKLGRASDRWGSR